MHSEFASRMAGLSGSAIRAIFKLLENPEIISFAGGAPSPKTFAVQDIAEISRQLLLEDGAKLLQYGITEGYAPLRRRMIDLAAPRGIAVDVPNILMLTGATQGLDLTSKAFLNPGDVLLVEAPTFLGALQIFNSYQADIRMVDMDAEGLDVDGLERKVKLYRPKMLYTIPTFQNPTGRTIGLERRQRIAQLAAEYDFMVLEDDPYGDLRFDGESLPAIKSMDAADKVIHLFTFSKIISPGLRVGAAFAAEDVIAKMAIGKQCADTHSTNLSQAIVDRVVESGMLQKSIPAARALYKEQLSAMLEMLRTPDFEGVYYTVPQGGLFVWCQLPQGVDGKRLLELALAQNVAFIPGEHFYADGSHPNTMRLNFSASSVEQIRTGMQRLGAVIKNYA